MKLKNIRIDDLCGFAVTDSENPRFTLETENELENAFISSKVTKLSFGRQKSKALLSTISFMAEELFFRARFIRWKRRFVTITETKPKKRRSLKRAFFPVIFLRSG